jgi:hypothetical protein
MITRLELKNYRGFEHYKLSGLAQVNLLVGKNNSGKSSILEAIHLLASGGDYGVLFKIARQRGEMLYEFDERERRPDSYCDISHFFNGHHISVGDETTVPRSFSIHSDSDFDSFETRIVQTSSNRSKLTFDEPMYRSGFSIVTRLEGKKEKARDFPEVPITEDGALSQEFAYRFGRLLRDKSDSFSIQFVSADSLERSTMTEMWNQVITGGKEEVVVAGMRILEPTVSSIAFLISERIGRFEKRGGILVGFQDSQRRYPLGTYGEGMRRMLALSLAMATAQNGILLIDEVDTGLHYSIMGDMLRLIVETAKRYNIQVFMTTHSLDCVRGLAWLCNTHPELDQSVSLQKIEPKLSSAVSLDAEQIKIAADQEIEVR